MWAQTRETNYVNKSKKTYIAHKNFNNLKNNAALFQNNAIKRHIKNKKGKNPFFMKMAKFARSRKLQNILTRFHLFLKLCTLIPEDDRKHPKHVASIVEYNKFAAFDGNV